MTETEFKNILTNDIKKVEHTLLSFLPDCKDGQESVVQAMEYSLVNGGKRLRPVLRLSLHKRAVEAEKMRYPLRALWNMSIHIVLFTMICLVWTMMI
jgi:geranylgeranyl diphosphate synthase type II